MSPFTVPTLSVYAPGDLNYIASLNADNTAIENALSQIAADLAAQFDPSQAEYVADVFERVLSTDPQNGVLGFNSLRFEAPGSPTASTVRLLGSSVTGSSKAVVLGSRCSYNGDLQVDVATDVLANDGVALADGDVVTVGVNATTNRVLQIKATKAGNVTLPLYRFDWSTANGVLRPRRVARTVLFDNTIEQLRQETPETFDFQLASGSSPFEVYFQVPYEHTLDKMFIGGGAVPTSNAGNTGPSVLTFTGGSTTLGTVEVSTHTTGEFHDSLASASAYFNGPAMPAGQVYLLSYDHSGGHDAVNFGVRVCRSYGLPTQSL